MLQHAERVSGNVSQTCRFFGVSRALFYIWKERYEKHGVAGLRDKLRRPHQIRFRIPPEIVSLILRIRDERRYGSVRTSLHLQRHYRAYVSPMVLQGKNERGQEDRKHSQASELVRSSFGDVEYDYSLIPRLRELFVRCPDVSLSEQTLRSPQASIRASATNRHVDSWEERK
jgi:hypothetical protein